jgi:hypothetical protein
MTHEGAASDTDAVRTLLHFCSQCKGALPPSGPSQSAPASRPNNRELPPSQYYNTTIVLASSDHIRVIRLTRADQVGVPFAHNPSTSAVVFFEVLVGPPTLFTCWNSMEFSRVPGVREISRIQFLTSASPSCRRRHKLQLLHAFQRTPIADLISTDLSNALVRRCYLLQHP